MTAKISLVLSLSMSVVAGVRTELTHAQNVSATSLVDQLKAQYKLTKIVPDSNSYKIAEPGTILVVKKEGIVGVPLGSNSVLEPVIYAIQKDADLHHSKVGPNTWKFEVGHEVYVWKLDIDAKHEKVLLTIVERESTNPVKPAYYKSLVDFEFPNGYLAGAQADQIEDVIQRVLSIENGTNDAQQHGGPNSSSSLTNEDIIKLVQAKLPDSVILSKIKSSSCEFDTAKR